MLELCLTESLILKETEQTQVEGADKSLARKVLGHQWKMGRFFLKAEKEF